MLAPFVLFHLALFFYRRHTVHVNIGWVNLAFLESARRVDMQAANSRY